MSDIERADELSPPPAPAGERLRAAREAQDLSLATVAERTRVPLRHLEAIEAGDYASLPSPTYATGFARAYARAVGADEVAVARDVRAEAAKLGRQPEYEPFVTADPVRLPSRGLVIVAAGVALAVIILAVLWMGTGWPHGVAGGPAGAPSPAPVVAAPAGGSRAVAPVSAPAGVRAGQVRLTANDTIWLRVYDAANKTLFLGTMKPGDTFDVPQGADHPRINIGRADKLAVTIDGKPVAALGTGERPIKDVPVDAASLAARQGGTAPIVTPSASPAAPVSAEATTRTSTRTGQSPRAATRPHRSQAGEGDETQRANRRSARAAARGEAPPVPTSAPAPSATTDSAGARP